MIPFRKRDGNLTIKSLRMKVSALLIFMLAALVPVAHADEDVF